jgi:hypothetical protein
MPIPSVLILTAALLAGCGQQHGDRTADLRATTSPSPLASSVPESTACPKQEPVHLDSSQGPFTDAFLCTSELRNVPGSGQWDFRVVRRVTGGLDALLQVYAEPDAKVPGNVICTLELPNPRVLWLHGDKVVAARAPRDVCSKPTRDARAAFEALTTSEVWAEKNRQVTSQQSLDSGCSDSWKDMLSIDEEFGGPKQTSPQPRPLGAGTWACLHDVKTDGNERVGKLASSRVFAAQQLKDLNAALAKADVDPSCKRSTHTRFALLLARQASYATYVALDGCAVQQDGGWWRAGDDHRGLLS